MILDEEDGPDPDYEPGGSDDGQSIDTDLEEVETDEAN
jgi:hypothetical protein